MPRSHRVTEFSAPTVDLEQYRVRRQTPVGGLNNEYCEEHYGLRARPRVPQRPGRRSAARYLAERTGRRVSRTAVRVDGRVREAGRSEEHTSELQSLRHLVCRLLLGKKH